MRVINQNEDGIVQHNNFMLCEPGLIKPRRILTFVIIKPRFTFAKWLVEIDKREEMDFDAEFKIIAKRELPVNEGLDYPLGRGHFGKAFLVKEKNGPRNNRLDFEN